MAEYHAKYLVARKPFDLHVQTNITGTGTLPGRCRVEEAVSLGREELHTTGGKSHELIMAWKRKQILPVSLEEYHSQASSAVLGRVM